MNNIKKFVLYGLTTKTPVKVVKKEIEEFSTIKVKEISWFDNQQESEDTRKITYFVVFKDQAVILKILRERVRLISKQNVTWNKYVSRSNTIIMQCFKCQEFGHTMKNCKNEERCVRCSENHSSKSCIFRIDPLNPYSKIPRNKIKCANCSEHHTANYEKCKARPTIVPKINNEKPCESYDKKIVQKLSEDILEMSEKLLDRKFINMQNQIKQLQRQLEVFEADKTILELDIAILRSQANQTRYSIEKLNDLQQNKCGVTKQEPQNFSSTNQPQIYSHSSCYQPTAQTANKETQNFSSINQPHILHSTYYQPADQNTNQEQQNFSLINQPHISHSVYYQQTAQTTNQETQSFSSTNQPKISHSTYYQENAQIINQDPQNFSSIYQPQSHSHNLYNQTTFETQQCTHQMYYSTPLATCQMSAQ